jgi:hypothetical protein
LQHQLCAERLHEKGRTVRETLQPWLVIQILTSRPKVQPKDNGQWCAQSTYHICDSVPTKTKDIGFFSLFSHLHTWLHKSLGLNS